MASTLELQWSLPSMVDGLNRGQRKILFSLLNNSSAQAKTTEVPEIARYAVERAAYNQGQQSAVGTILAMAQNFVGTNNINLLEPHGYNRTRVQGDKDPGDENDVSGAPFAYTRLAPLARLVFPKGDDILLNYLEDSGQSIEPIWYIPVIPMVLINGSRGSNSCVPNYNPRDIIANLRRLLNNERLEPMDPWYRGFKGRIEKIGTTDDGSTYTTTGLVEVVEKNIVQIKELPIHCWIYDFLMKLEDKGKESSVKDVYCHEVDVSIDLILDEKYVQNAKEEDLFRKLNLQSTIETTKMHLFDRTGATIRKYKTPEEIFEEFFDLRIEYYEKRKESQLEPLELDLVKVTNKLRFIVGVDQGDIKAANRGIDDLVLELRQKGFAPLSNSTESLQAGKVTASDYEYLLSISIRNMAREKVQELYAEKRKLERKIKELRRATPRSLWMKDLDALEAGLNRRDAQQAKMEEKERARREKRDELRRASQRKKPAKKLQKATENEPLKRKPAARKNEKTEKVILVESDEDVLSLRALLASYDIDSSSEKEKRGHKEKGAGGERKSVAEKPPKAAPRGTVVTRKRTAEVKVGRAEEERAPLLKPVNVAAAEDNVSAAASPEKKVIKTRGRAAMTSSRTTGHSVGEVSTSRVRLTRGNKKKAQVFS